MDTKTRQVERATLRREALATMPYFDLENTAISRSRRRLMARARGNRMYRSARNLPELAHMTHQHQRSGLRK